MSNERSKRKYVDSDEPVVAGSGRERRALRKQSFQELIDDQKRKARKEDAAAQAAQADRPFGMIPAHEGIGDTDGDGHLSFQELANLPAMTGAAATLPQAEITRALKAADILHQIRPEGQEGQTVQEIIDAKKKRAAEENTEADAADDTDWTGRKRLPGGLK